MSGIVARWLPHPLMTLTLLVVWLVLNDTVAPGHVVLGTLLAVGIPRFTQRFWREPVKVRRPLLALRFLLRVAVDIVLANFTVARLILGDPARLRPGFIRIPLTVQNDFAITLLASVISLTPGTVSSDLDETRTHLLVHVFDLDDADALVAEIKARYEAPIAEILP